MTRRRTPHHLSTEYLLRRMVMQENRERIAAWVGLALEPHREGILSMHKWHKRKKERVSVLR